MSKAMRAGGFTLVELMAVLLIAGILLAAGAPALQNFIAEQQLIGAANAFFHGASLTRAEALRQGGRAEMTPADGRDWNSGWRIQAGQRTVMTQPPLPPGIAVAYTQGGAVVAFHPSGQPLTRGSWYFSAGGMTRVVIINFIGRVRICNPARDNNCGSG
ncbi:GspH/FimT family pseudopilin [Herbaspirillum sp.]|uniref:GspH/FimT family pseudopilin n=1 Tax=Herbaspirillum sp. TaxID=1890675 RepID=UPI0031D62778